MPTEQGRLARRPPVRNCPPPRHEDFLVPSPEIKTVGRGALASGQVPMEVDEDMITAALHVEG
ncbi:hypothetical protein [Amycolatopsis cihanbeyliensis]|uniref:Uncharacterized protein n=1 Tax=Amycolatopsis cihanbeyliensis TaxID=1128664 RepID=A0A542DET8_AMYCI|nr:hypothetical protein [Amycolatopsis cihanbeyliensis]TQJ01595.1 hypothetical protein FB471_1288 [Amycolatopsis cihanbeyliensis]